MRHLLIDLGSMFWPCWHTAKEADEAWRNTINRVEDLVSKVCDAERDAVTILADSPKNWRHEIYEAYKSNRKDKPPEALVQLGKAHEALAKLYHVVSVTGFEADDLAASCCKVLRIAGFDVMLATADKDWLQLLAPGVRVFNVKHGTMGLPFAGEFTSELVVSHFGVRPDQVRDLLGIAGDTSDSIPGVPGVGFKTASKLLRAHETAQGILTWADGADESDKLAAKFRNPEMRQLMDLSISLASLKRDAFRSSAEMYTDPDAVMCAQRDTIDENGFVIPVETEPSSEFIELGDTMPEPTHRLTVPGVAPGKTTGVLHDSAPPKKEQRTQMDNERSTNGSNARPATPAPKSRFQVVRGATTLPSATILTGRSGIGKTWFASEIPDRFFLSVEQGLSGIPASRLMEIDRYEKPRSFGELCGMTEEVIAMAPRYKALVVDTMSGVEKLINKAACQRESVAHMEAKEYARVWAAAMPFHQEYQELLDKARYAGMQVWVIAHSAEVTEMTDDGDTFSKWDLYMQGSGKALINSRSLWRNWADHVFFLDWDARVKKGNSMGQKSIGQYKSRILRTRETPRYYAKTRSGLPEILPATYEDVRRAFAGSNAAATEKLKAKLSAVVAELSDADREAIEAQVSEVGNDQGKLSAALSRAEGMLSASNEEE